MRNKQLTVSSLVRYLKAKLDQDPMIQRVIVSGEISNFTFHRSGHWYFTLKDESSRINCVMFSSNASRCQFKPKEGDSVLVQANVSVFESSGQLQLYVLAMKPMGLGDLYVRFEALKRKLHQEGLFDPQRKKALPRYPMNLCVITGKNTAARQDIITTLARRWPVAKVSEIAVLVQGEEAAQQICTALAYADIQHFDLLILARGGGSIEDLWSFNEEIVARQLASLTTPVICGVGHEVDVTIADLVCDHRAPTPTGAAEMATPDIRDILRQLFLARQQLETTMLHNIQLQRKNWLQRSQAKVFQDPLSLLQETQMKLDYLSSRLGNTEKQVFLVKRRLQNLQSRLIQQSSYRFNQERKRLDGASMTLTHLQKQTILQKKAMLASQIKLLDAYSPLKILGRGYSLVYEKEALLRSVKQVQIGEKIVVQLSDGNIHATVKMKEEKK